ncbi:GGDEF domain-containing protein [Sphingomonas sanxanigenens]|uniref:diguanylate cyclase n=1 Tax=Sphingomonas sanxanigenens DSM 19645 = NX02 TaxID=1123269 RepID=W0AIU9_9SPHN|nr:GGDEF domain-containing protein [Sphingomonas sanxanigenens]AHE57036.1 hypothetical protein NX02_27250 [Sphingomonas sanxanigenens DSM 19645 = NX02]
MMTGAAFALSGNIAFALLFAIAFLLIGLSDRGHRNVLLFALTYAVGILTPASELLIPLVPAPAPFVWLSHAAFVTAFFLMAIGLSRFFGLRPPWRLLCGLLAASFALRLAIWGGARGSFAYEFLYQLPFAAMLAVCAGIVLASRRRDGWTIALFAIFALLSGHFLLKPSIATWFHPGQTARDYAGSTYALISQVTSGVLLIATGLQLILVVMREMLITTRLQADTDMMTGLLNRRGFDDRARQLLARRDGGDVAVVMIDIDHFKSINDRFGHAAGDVVICALADLLGSFASPAMLIGRLGGEEFAMLRRGSDAAEMGLVAEAVRARFARLAFDGLPAAFRATLSAGIAERAHAEPLSQLMHRADGLLYEAKHAGRDTVIVQR